LKLLVQRVSSSRVLIQGNETATIGKGVLVFVSFDPEDTYSEITKLSEKLLNYKFFSGEDKKLSLSVLESKAEILVVPQVTLSINTKKGLKPSFSGAANPGTGLKLFGQLINLLAISMKGIKAGEFGADMSIELVNDGPITFWFEA